MKTQSTRSRLLATSMICGVAAFAMAAPAMAQDQAAADTEVEALVVTGSRIPQPNLETTSPVTQVTSADIDTQGVNRVEDLVNQLPQAFSAQGSNISNGASGTATVDLRGLGSARTLVLVDGRRLPAGSPQDPAADLNQIPAQLVDRVEVLTGGASAVYGSDAISGVVNFIMKKDYEGLQIDAQYNFFQHHNDFDAPGNLRQVIAGRGQTNPSQFALPDDNVVDGEGYEITAIMGVNAPDGRGNITAYAGYRHNDPVLQGDRDFSACTLGSAAGPNFTCGGSGTSATGTFTDFATFSFTVDQTTGNFRNFVASTDQYNFGPLNFFQRPDERYTLGAFGRYEINEHVEAFTQLMFADSSSLSQIAPSGNFFSTNTINCGNPLLSAQQSAAIGCSAQNIADDDVTSLYIGRRNVEGGPRTNDLRFQSFRIVGGFRGELNDAWSYDVAGQYSRVQLTSIQNDFSTVRLRRSLDVVNVDGVPTCRSVVDGTDANCIPYNIFSPGGVTRDALNYLEIPLILTGSTVQQVVTAVITGQLGEYGLKSPWTQDGIAVAIGAEYRRDALEANPDVSLQTGDGAGQGGPTTALTGATGVYDLFGEIQVPLLQDLPFAHLLQVDAAYRYSDYNTGVQTHTYKFGAEWAPVEDVRLRASFQRAVRAPNVIELFSTQGFSLFDMDEDPCGPAMTATLAQCTATGVPAANYGSGALDSPAGQYTQLTGGNPDLAPEEADTYTVGVVFTPRFLSGFNLSVDYFNIEVAGLISAFGAQNTVAACYQQNDQSACDRINRNPNGQLWVGSGFVENLNINIGGLKTSGVDVVGNYSLPLERFGMGDMGRLNFNFVGTYLEELFVDTGAPGAGGGTVQYDCVGFFGAQCGTPNPKWRHRARVSWATPWNVEISGTWRYRGDAELFVLGACGAGQVGPCGNAGTRLDRFFDAENYFDLAGSWRVTDNTRLRFGVNNILDNDPPISASVGAGQGNGNTFPQVYDSLGRYVFVGITADF